MIGKLSLAPILHDAAWEVVGSRAGPHLIYGVKPETCVQQISS